MKALLLIGELALVYQKTCRGCSFFDLVHDLIEMHHAVFRLLASHIQAEREIGRRQQAGDGDFHVPERIGRHRLA